MAASSSSTPSSSSSSSPCGACKFLRRKCVPSECIFAPYFPSDEPLKFANAHKIFGASNMAKILSELHPSQRADAVSSLSYEAEARIKDPVYGCVGAISYLKRHIQYLEQELRVARAELARYMGAISHSQVLRPPQLPAASTMSQMNHQQQQQHLPFSAQAMAEVVHPFLLSESLLSSSASTINVAAAASAATDHPNNNSSILAVVSSSTSPPLHRPQFVDHNFWLLSNAASAPHAPTSAPNDHDHQIDVPPTNFGHGHSSYVDRSDFLGTHHHHNNNMEAMQLARSSGAPFYSNHYRAPHLLQRRLVDVRSTSSYCGGDGGGASNVSSLSSSDPTRN